MFNDAADSGVLSHRPTYPAFRSRPRSRPPRSAGAACRDACHPARPDPRRTVAQWSLRPYHRASDAAGRIHHFETDSRAWMDRHYLSSALAYAYSFLITRDLGLLDATARGAGQGLPRRENLESRATPRAARVYEPLIQGDPDRHHAEHREQLLAAHSEDPPCLIRFPTRRQRRTVPRQSARPP